MKKKTSRLIHLLVASVLALYVNACAPTTTAQNEEQPLAEQAPITTESQKAEATTEQQKTKPLEVGQLPVRYQKPSYVLQDASSDLGVTDEEIAIPVGADISSTSGSIPLRDILKRLAAMKKMNISWASDVDQYALVDVDIKAEDDFFTAIANILRQMDYFHEVQGNTIVVKYRETKKFHIALPFISSIYNTGVGGDVLGAGGGAGSELSGNVQIISSDNKFDIWDNIRRNIDQILEIWEETVPVPPSDTETAAQTPAEKASPTQTTKRNVQSGKGYYSIDEHIGLITVTAPRPLVLKIENYLNNLKNETFRQISIEAKIVEVEISDVSKKGIDWSNLLDTSLNIQMFGANGIIYAPDTAERAISKLSIEPADSNGLSGNPFNILISALETQGDTNVLANPKLSVLNGQPALINIGETLRYIKEVKETVTETTVSTSVTTDSVMSGLGMSVIASILDDNEVVLSLTPVTSQVDSPMEEKEFAGLLVQLPKIKIREMNTIVRIKSGEILMIGGLIDNTSTTDNNKVPLLGDIPGLRRLFSHETQNKSRKELVILLQPTIL